MYGHLIGEELRTLTANPKEGISGILNYLSSTILIGTGEFIFHQINLINLGKKCQNAKI